MRLSRKFSIEDLNGTPILMDTTGEWSGIVKCKGSIRVVIDSLQSGITKDELLRVLCDTYDAPEDVLKSDLEMVIKTLQSIGALEDSDI